MPKKLFTKEDYFNPKERFNEQVLSDMVFTYLSQENHKRSQLKSKERQDTIKFYPSSIGMSDHDIVLGMMGYIGKAERGETIMILENGTSFHERMEAIFEDMGIMIAPELSLKHEELCISGRSDAIIWNFLREEDEPDGEEIELRTPDGELIYKGPENYVLLVEFKSISENGFYGLRKSKPKDAHEQQLQLYFHLTGIKKGIIYYENKNNQKTVEYIVDKNDEIIDSVVSRIQRLVGMARRGEVPEPDYTPTDFKGRYSKYRDMAFPNMNPVQFIDLFKKEESEELPF
mgnify:CR=1 FL=1